MTSSNDSNVCSQGLEKSKHEWKSISINNFNSNVCEEEPIDLVEKYVIILWKQQNFRKLL
jgi:hypothetical protein